MKDISKMKEHYEALGEEIKALEQQGEAAWPQAGDLYEYIDAEGDIYHDRWQACYDDEYRKLTGNCFKTKEEAEFYRKKLETLGKMREIAKGFTPDWADESKAKYSITYDHQESDFYIFIRREIQLQGVVFFEEYADAQACIDTIGEDIKKYVFEIKG